MEGRLTQTVIIKKLKEKGVSLLTPPEFKRIFGIEKENTAYKILGRLVKRGILKHLIKRKYLFSFSDYNDFQVANFLHSPSYISLETALSFYGIITQFPYPITSVTPKRTKIIRTLDKEFSFSHIKADLFLGYEKKESFLIATPEKALFDYLYLFQKGLRIFEKEEFDLRKIKKGKVLKFIKRIKDKRLKGRMERILKNL